jgi:hypothetical protein
VSRSHDQLTAAALGGTTLPSLTIGNSEEHTGAGLDIDNASASPDTTELTPVEHFSSILQSAQRRAAEAEDSESGRNRVHYTGKYTGKSERTIRRQKKALRKLQA